MQLPGDRVGPEQAEATWDIGRGRKRTSPSPKRSSAPSRRPHQLSPTRQRPKAGAMPRGAPTQKGERPGRRIRAALARRGLAALPGAARRSPPPNPARRSLPPDARTPREPPAREEVGVGRKARPDLPHAAGRRGLPGSRGGSTGNQTRAGPALPAASRRSVPGKVGLRGRGPEGARGGRRRTAGGRVLPSSRHARPRPAGRWGRRTGGGAAIPRRRRRRRARRGGAAGEREAEKARRGQLPSGGRREMQLSLRACRRGYKWGRAGRSGLQAGRGPGGGAPRPSPGA